MQTIKEKYKRPRSPKGHPEHHVTSVSLYPQQLDALDYYASELRISKSAFMRMLIDNYEEYRQEQE